MRARHITVLAVAAVVAAQAPARAALVPLQGGALVYDTERKVAYLADPQFALEALPKPIRDELVKRGEYDTTQYRTDTGGMTYAFAEKVLSAMDGVRYLGHTGWRFPSPDEDCAGTDCFDGELGVMFVTWQSLDDAGRAALLQDDVVTSGYYWCADPSPGDLTTPSFAFGGGLQGERHKSFNQHLLWPVVDLEADVGDAARCTGGRIKALGQFASDVLRCAAKGVTRAEFDDGACFDRAAPKLETGWEKSGTKAARKGELCPTLSLAGARAILDPALAELVASLRAALPRDDKAAAKLGRLLLRAAAARYAATTKALAVDATRPDAERVAAKVAKARAKLARSWEKALAKAERSGLQYAGPPLAEVDAAIDVALDALTE